MNDMAERELVRQSSISQSNWTDYIFSRSKHIIAKLTNPRIEHRRRMYIWWRTSYIISQSQDENEIRFGLDIELCWFRRVQMLKWFVNCILMKKRMRENVSRILNEYDLMGEDISEYSPDDICQVQLKGGKVCYTSDDIVGILKMNLQKREAFSVASQTPIDPYTNEEWSVPVYYHIQGWMRRRKFNMRKMPYVVYFWLNSPYVSSTMYAKYSSPYLLHEFLTSQARYEFIRNDSTRNDMLNNVRDMIRNVNIPSRRVDWDVLHDMNDVEWDSIWKPIIHYWYSPYCEWSVDDTSFTDERTKEWQKQIMLRLHLSNAWIHRDITNVLENAQDRTGRFIRIGVQRRRIGYI